MEKKSLIEVILSSDLSLRRIPGSFAQLIPSTLLRTGLSGPGLFASLRMTASEELGVTMAGRIVTI
jgi:hypothetical protein